METKNRKIKRCLSFRKSRRIYFAMKGGGAGSFSGATFSSHPVFATRFCFARPKLPEAFPVCSGSRLFWRLILRHYQVRYGLQIPVQTSIGRGFRIAHFGAIVVNPAAEVGDNFNIAQGAVIGYAPPRRGQSEGGSPKIGNNVCVGANAIVIGNISIGDYCVIAPGAFVNQDMPPHTIALGNPATFHHKHQASSSLIVYSLTPSEQ